VREGGPERGAGGKEKEGLRGAGGNEEGLRGGQVEKKRRT